MWKLQKSPSQKSKFNVKISVVPMSMSNVLFSMSTTIVSHSQNLKQKSLSNVKILKKGQCQEMYKCGHLCYKIIYSPSIDIFNIFVAVSSLLLFCTAAINAQCIVSSLVFNMMIYIFNYSHY